MRKLLLTILTIILAIASSSQVTTIVNDDRGRLINKEYAESDSIEVSIVDNFTAIEIDLSGGERESSDIILRYIVSGGPTLMWNQRAAVLNIIFLISSVGSNPIGGLIHIESGSIMLFYADGSSILYMGAGVRFE